MEHLTSRANLSLLLSALTLFTTCTFYYYNIALTWQMHHATTFNELHREYAAPEMMEALDTLYSFVEERHGPEHVAADLTDLMANGGEDLRHIEHARRRVQQWYAKLCLLHEFGLIDRKFLDRFPGRQKARRFIEIVEPIANTLRVATDRTPSEVFDAVREVYGLEDVTRFVPRSSASGAKEEL